MARYEDLVGKVALVTGGSRGLGAATCRALAVNAAKVAVNGRDPAAVEGIVRELRDKGAQAVAAVADCTDARALVRVREKVEAEFGPVEVLVAMASASTVWPRQR